MKRFFFILGIMLLCTPLAAQQEDQSQEPSPEELALKECERLEDLLKLEDWQIFYVDSTLCHDIAEMQKEMHELQRSRVENRDLYLMIQDKWMEAIQNQYKQIFTAEQWNNYLKTGGEKIIVEREKRRAKAAGIKYKKK